MDISKSRRTSLLGWKWKRLLRYIEETRWNTMGEGVARGAWHRGISGHGARSPLCSWTALKSAWAEYYAGPGQLTDHEKEGPRPWLELHRGSPNNFCGFFFSYLQPLDFVFPGCGIRPFTHFETARGERRGNREQRSKKEEDTEVEGRKETAFYFAVTLPQSLPRHPDTHPLYIYHYSATVNEFCSLCLLLVLSPCVWYIRVYLTTMGYMNAICVYS